MKRIVRTAPFFLLLLFGLADAPMSNAVWLSPTLLHLLGTDEFGRDIAFVLLISIGRSFASALALAGLTLVLSGLLAIVVALIRIQTVSILLQIAIRILESIPIFVWVLVAFASLKGASNLVVWAAFVIAMLPTLTSIIAGEFRRLDQEPFLEAAKLLGAGLSKRVTRHILPNAAPVLAPLYIQTLGIAFAIRGAIGLLGFSNRTDYDMGIILLRGKENFESHPLIMVSAVISIALIYVFLDWTKEGLLQSGDREIAFIEAEAMLQ